jgi:hypothetical protein
MIDGGGLNLPGPCGGGEQQEREAVRPTRNGNADATAGWDQRVELFGKSFNE